jgi:hypothetical protein
VDQYAQADVRRRCRHDAAAEVGLFGHVDDMAQAAAEGRAGIRK